MERPVVFEGMKTLFGILSEPDDRPRVGVVLVHGWSGYRAGPHRMFVGLSRALCRVGVASLRFDVSGRGDSGGAFDDATLDTMIEDTLTAAAFLRKETGVRRLVLSGICSGGNVSLGAASLDKTVDGLALFSTPLFAPQKKALGIERSRARAMGTYAVKALRPSTWYKLAKGMIDFRAVRKVIASSPDDPSKKDSSRDIMRELSGYSGRMLFVYGSRDTESAGAPEYYRDFADANDIDATFATIEGSDHNFYAAAWQGEMIEHVRNWISSANL
jgi:predicted alpha/beta-hydrolase family hydrolase